MMFPRIGGKPTKWIVKIMENPNFLMDDLGVPLFLETPIWILIEPSNRSWKQ